MNDATPVNVIDTHVHTRQLAEGNFVYNFTAKDVLNDLARGGVIVAHEMPNVSPPLTTFDEMKKRIIALRDRENYGGTYFCYNGHNIEEFRKCLADPEVRPYLVWVKIYPAAESGGSVTTNFWAAQDMHDFSLEADSPLDQIAALCAAEQLSLTIHCEEPVEKAGIVAEGLYGKTDDDTEPNFVERIALPLCQRHPGLKLIVAHISHKKTVRLLQDAWDTGMKNLYAEITPHHALLSTAEIQEKLQKDEVFGFCHPFIKIAEKHRYAINSLMLDGKYSDQILYGSDHAPHSQKAKEKGMWGVPNPQWAQIMLAWFRAKWWDMHHPLIQKFFSGNAERVFANVPEWTERFRKKAGSILFTPSDYIEGKSIPHWTHNGVVYNPWWRLVSDEIKAHWVTPRKRAA